MNSLVVLLSVMALAAASPSAPAVLSYAAVPAVAVAPSAVSHQSRIDIKSSPAVISETITPIARSVVAEPAAVVDASAVCGLCTAPAAYATPVAYAAPAAYAAVAPAAISSQSRVDIKSSPAIVSTVAAGPVFSSYASPIAYSAPVASIYSPSAIAAVPNVFRSVSNVVAAPAVAAPAVVSETPEVAAARAAHLEAKAAALNEAHVIHKRSVVLNGPALSYASLPAATAYSSLGHNYAGSPVVYPTPLAHVSSYAHAPAFARIY